MPRSFGTIQCSIWDNEDFLALSVDAKAAYFMLSTQKEIEACGSLALTLRRWARMLSGGDPRVLVGWLNELADARFIVIDKDTEELLVRTFVKWDGGYKHAVRVKAVVSSAEAIRSPILRAAIAAELEKLGVPHNVPVPPKPRKGATPTPVESLSPATGDAVESLSSGTPVPVESGGVVVNLGDHKSNPHPSTAGAGAVALTSDPLPSPYCQEHPAGTDVPCRGCGRARAAHEAAILDQQNAARTAALAAREAERVARAEAIAACTLCADDGYRITPDGPGAVCNHQPLNPGGRARAFAQLTGGNP
jgi:hypothetical protein